MSYQEQIANSSSSAQASSLPALAKGITNMTSRDAVSAVVKAAFNVVPVVGGCIASLLDDFIPASREKRIREFAERVADDLRAIHTKIDANYVTSEEFAYLFTRVFQDVTRDYQQSKLDAYRNLLVNSLKYNVDSAIKESYLKRIEDLTALHLEVLTCFHSDHRNQSKLGNRDHFNGSTGSLSLTIRSLLPHLDEELINAAIFDLDAAGITDRVQTTMRTIMTAHGAAQLEGRLTAYGRKFVTFVSQS